MASNFDFGIMDALMEKASMDESGELMKLIAELIMLSKKAGNAGLTMAEIASSASMGFFISQEPELENLIDFFLSKMNPDDEYLN